MYPKDVFDNKQTRTSMMNNVKWVAVYISLAIILIYFRITVSVYIYNIKYIPTILTISLLILYLNISIHIYRTAIFREKERIRESISKRDATSSLARYSSIELLSKESSSYRFIKDIYMPEIKGFKTVFLSLTHHSKIDDIELAKEIFVYLHNYCMKNNLILSRYDMNVDNKIPSLDYYADSISKKELSANQLMRLNSRLDLYRKISESSRVTKEIIQITSTNMENNLFFIDYVKSIILKLNNMHNNYTLDILSKDEIESFIGDYLRLNLVELDIFDETEIIDGRTDRAIVLHKVTLINGEELQYTPITKIRKYSKSVKGGQRDVKKHYNS